MDHLLRVNGFNYQGGLLLNRNRISPLSDAEVLTGTRPCLVVISDTSPIHTPVSLLVRQFVKISEQSILLHKLIDARICK